MSNTNISKVIQTATLLCIDIKQLYCDNSTEKGKIFDNISLCVQKNAKVKNNKVLVPDNVTTKNMNVGNKCDKLSSLKEVLNTDEYNLDKMSILDKLCELFDVDETITEDNNELKQSVDFPNDKVGYENDKLLQKKWSNKGLKRSRHEEHINSNVLYETI